MNMVATDEQILTSPKSKLSCCFAGMSHRWSFSQKSFAETVTITHLAIEITPNKCVRDITAQTKVRKRDPKTKIMQDIPHFPIKKIYILKLVFRFKSESIFQGWFPLNSSVLVLECYSSSQTDPPTRCCLLLWIKALVKWIDVNEQCGVSVTPPLLWPYYTRTTLCPFSSSHFICLKQFPAEEATSELSLACVKKKKKNSLAVPSRSDLRDIPWKHYTVQRRGIFRSYLIKGEIKPG